MLTSTGGCASAQRWHCGIAPIPLLLLSCMILRACTSVHDYNGEGESKWKGCNPFQLLLHIGKTSIVQRTAGTQSVGDLFEARLQVHSKWLEAVSRAHGNHLDVAIEARGKEIRIFPYSTS